MKPHDCTCDYLDFSNSTPFLVHARFLLRITTNDDEEDGIATNYDEEDGIAYLKVKCNLDLSNKTPPFARRVVLSAIPAAVLMQPALSVLYEEA
jgi:hypothetical protein